MSPSDLLYLDIPVRSNALHLGQLLPDPLSPVSDAYRSRTITPKDEEDKVVQAHYKHQLSTRLDGRYTTQAAEVMSHEDTFTLEAEKSTFRQLRPITQTQIFESVCRNTDALSWMLKKAASQRPFYFLTGIQELRNAKIIRHESTASSPRAASRIRRDSAMDTSESSSNGVYGIEVREVRCKYGRPEEPHALSDVGYLWSYYPIGEEMQLAVGLGKVYSAEKSSRSDGDGAYASDGDDDAEGWWD